MRRVQQIFRHVSMVVSHLCGALFKAVVTSMVAGFFVISVMHYMGVPIPSAVDLLRGVSRLADVLS